MLQDPDGQVIEAVSISAGWTTRDRPQLAALMAAGRLIVSSATDFGGHRGGPAGRRTEGILAAVESAHAVAALPRCWRAWRVAEAKGTRAADRCRERPS